jgi:hypothetical protein
MFLRTCVGLLAATLFSLHGVRASRSSPSEPASVRYQQRLSALRRTPPQGELVSLESGAGALIRRINLWVKIAPADQTGASTQRSVTVYLEDTAGNRIRTIPDEVEFGTLPPARLSRPPHQALRDGEAQNGLVFGPGQEQAKLDVSSPVAAIGIGVDVPSEPRPRGLILSAGAPRAPGHGRRVLEPGQLTALLDDAREHLRVGRPLHAKRTVTTRARLLLEARDLNGALEAFRVGASEFNSPVCAWGEAQLLRLRGQEALARQKEAVLVSQHPRSVPAQFVTPVEGEQWLTPFNPLFSVP